MKPTKVIKKSHFIVLFMLSACLTASAQLKVDSLGSTSIGVLQAQTDALLTVGNTSTNISLGKIGVLARMSGINSEKKIGLHGYLNGSTTDTQKSIGVMGTILNGFSGKTFGVIGSIQSHLNGAGVYGTAGGYGVMQGETLSGKYAGYFAGPTYVSGTLTATEVVTPSDITLKENVIPISDEEEATGSTLNNLINLNVIKYNYKPREYKADPDEAALYEDETLAAAAEQIAKLRIQEMAAQKHYGLSAQELQEIYPELVRESQDGTLGVNYVELVPLLIRSIQELKAEIDKLKGIGYNVESSPNIAADNILKDKNKTNAEKPSDFYPITLDGKVVGHKKANRVKGF